MFELELYDSKGTKLNEGDIVEVCGNARNKFYSEVKWLEEEQVLTPFHTFSYSGFVKVDKVPSNAVKSSEERFNMWYIQTDGEDQQHFENYLLSWRECEHLLEQRCYRIKRKQEQLKLF